MRGGSGERVIPMSEIRDLRVIAGRGHQRLSRLVRGFMRCRAIIRSGSEGGTGKGVLGFGIHDLWCYRLGRRWRYHLILLVYFFLTLFCILLNLPSD